MASDKRNDGWWNGGMVASSDEGEVLDIVDVVEDWESGSDPEPH